MRRLTVAILPLVIVACNGDSAREPEEAPVVREPTPGERDSVPEQKEAPGAREPTSRERSEIAAVARRTYAYTSSARPYGYRGRLPNLSRLHPKVARVRVSATKPAFASAAVELRDSNGRRHPGTLALLLRRIENRRLARDIGPWELIGSEAARFRRGCTESTPPGVRAVICPDPWSVLDYPRPRIRLDTSSRSRLRSPDLHAVDWDAVVLPGAACGATRPIRLRNGRALFRSALKPWWPLVDVATTRVSYGDLNGDGRDEAAVGVVCSNGGGTAAGQFAFASVVFGGRGHVLRVIGIITPRQPVWPHGAHVPIVGRVEIRRGKARAHEFWYGPKDGTCCASGRATTVWAYANGRLRPARTVIQRPPQE